MSLTKRLYYGDSYTTEFEANAIGQGEVEGKPAVVLDATYFYPTSGGQPNDLGTLNGIPMLDVIDAEDKILHVLAAPLPVGPVQGKIDWARRLDHMQQHSGQHILSQAFIQELGAETVSFHLGAEVCTIDVDLAALDAQQATRAEELANRVVLENRPISVREYSEGEISAVPLRKVPAAHGVIRVVTVADFDVCACGGTHLRAAGEVGSIHVRRWEKRKGQTRVEFLCGWRALRDHRTRNAICQEVAGKLSVGVEELPQAVARLLEAEQGTRRQMESLRKRLLEAELPRLAGEAEQVGNIRLLCKVLEGYDAGNMRYVAQNLTQSPGTVVLLGVTEPAPQICLARSSGIDLDMGQVLREAVAPFGGRGGGKGPLAQGGGVSAEQLTLVLEAARERVRAR